MPQTADPALDLPSLASDLIAMARAKGADAADVILVEGTSVEAGCRLGAMEDVGRAEGRDLGLRVMIGQRQANVSTTDLSPASFGELVDRCVAMARYAPEDPYCGLAPEDRLARSVPDLDLEDSAAPDTDKLFEMALEAEAIAREGDLIINSNGAGASYTRSRVVLATSAGFSRSYGVTRYALSCSVVAGDENGMEVDGESTTTRHFTDLDTPAAVGREAAERARKRLSPRKVSTRSVPVIYDQRMASGLLGHLLGAISGASVARGTSFLKNAMETLVFPEGVFIYDEPHLPRGRRSVPFDGEGVANTAHALIDNGRLTTWLLDSASARQLGLETTGHAARGTGGPPSQTASNVRMAPGGVSAEAMIAGVTEGFYVTKLFGHGVNGVTGDYSRGAGGFWIENGALAYPVSEVTVAGNLKDMFANVTPADDLVIRRGVDAPTVMIEGMTVAGS